MRESPSLKLMQLFGKKGAFVRYNDPFVPKLDLDGSTHESLDINTSTLKEIDCVVIATDHSSYDFEEIVGNSKLVFDCRGVTRGMDAKNIFRLGE